MNFTAEIGYFLRSVLTLVFIIGILFSCKQGGKQAEPKTLIHLSMGTCYPWGPWKTVYYTRDWDIGPGESSSIPTKWMSDDGKTCYMVFSGDDYFSLRKLTLVEKKYE